MDQKSLNLTMRIGLKYLRPKHPHFLHYSRPKSSSPRRGLTLVCHLLIVLWISMQIHSMYPCTSLHVYISLSLLELGREQHHTHTKYSQTFSKIHSRLLPLLHPKSRKLGSIQGSSSTKIII